MLANTPTPGIAGLDHAVIAVRDLDAAQETYTRMGFTLAPRGLHSTGSSNHNIMVGPDNYFELLTVPRPNPMQSYFYEFSQLGDGMAALALSGTDWRTASVALREKGFEPAQPLQLSREVTQGSRHGTASFTITNLEPRTTPGAQVFLCQHHTRELVWLPELMQHANGAHAVAAVAFIADNVAHQAGIYAKLLGNWPERIDEGMKVETGADGTAAAIAVCTRAALQARLAGVDLPDRAHPHLAALFIRVKDRAATYATLRAGNFNAKRMSDGSIAIDAREAHGVAMVFG
jgi:catechol 2,3-dioxygenase-like lactoylglutathione lyase family enzyme